MANCLIAYYNRANTASLSLGSWLAGLPLANLKTDVLGVVARSTDDALASTKFLIDIGVDKSARTVGLVNHNLSLAAKVRVRCSEDDSTMAANVRFDSGWVDVWPSVFESTELEWESPYFWSGQYSDEQREGYTWTFIASAADNFVSRYWLVEIDDTTNAAGYIQIGRLFIGEAWQPDINMQYGAGIGWEDPSEIQTALSGAEYSDDRTKYRVARFTLNGMSDVDAYGAAFDIMRRVGTTKEVLFLYDPDDTVHSLRRQFMGRFRVLNQIENPSLDVHSTVFEIKERL